jgi:hypothetical protein
MGCLPLVAWPRAAGSGRAFAARQRYPQLDRRERAGGNPRGPPHLPPSGATRGLARRRPPVENRIHHERDRSRRPGSKLFRARRSASTRLMRPCARAKSRLPANSGATLHVELVTHRAAGCRSSQKGLTGITLVVQADWVGGSKCEVDSRVTARRVSAAVIRVAMTFCRGFRNRRSELRVEPARKYMDRPAVGIVSGVDDELIVEREARPVVQTVRVKGLQDLLRPVV